MLYRVLSYMGILVSQSVRKRAGLYVLRLKRARFRRNSYGIGQRHTNSDATVSLRVAIRTGMGLPIRMATQPGVPASRFVLSSLSG